ncbi:MAG: metal ABC transporter substrate-binding protein, partial [Chloroflexi bacterium]|nr:metal ABC transporter substrate-binding protein [Chloroflexota bacterium]
MKVVASIYPLGYFAERIGGDRVEVEVLIGPGVEAHGFEPATSHLRSIEAADVIVMNGLELEPWLERALEALGDDAAGIVVEAADATQAIEGFEHGHDHGHEDEHEGEEHEDEHEGEEHEDEHEGEEHEDEHEGEEHEDEHEGEEHEDEHEGEEHEGKQTDGEPHGKELDPQVWLSPKLTGVQVERIRDALVAVDADNADDYRERADTLIADLNELHADFEAGLAACKHDHFVTSHA